MTDVPHFKTLLAKIAEKQKFYDYDTKTEEVLSGGANYTSQLYTVQIKDKDNVLHLFAKIAAMGKTFRSQAPKIFDTEYFAYMRLAKIYNELQEQCEVPVEDRLLFPKLYGCNPKEFEETLVLEDLAAQGYSAFDRLETVDWPYAAAAVAELAKMHALSFAYAKRCPDEFQETVARLNRQWDAISESRMKGMQITINRSVSITREENRDRFRAYCASLDPQFFTVYYKPSRAPVLTHGDYRPNNLMHRKRIDGTIEIKIVDLQTLQGGSPVVDLLYFVFTGSDEQFRAAHYERLLDHYYEQLARAMRRLALDPAATYSREDFRYELAEKLPYGLGIALFTLPCITIDAENAPQLTDDLEVSSFYLENTSSLYTDRLNGLINDFVKWGILN